VSHAPAIGGVGGDHFGGIHRSISNALFPKERSLLSFFHRVLFSKEDGNKDKKAAKARTFFPLFPSYSSLKRKLSRPAFCCSQAYDLLAANTFTRLSTKVVAKRPSSSAWSGLISAIVRPANCGLETNTSRHAIAS